MHAEQEAGLQALARLVVDAMELRRVSAALAEAVKNVRDVNGLLPICAWCKGIRNDQGYWQQVETYLRTRTSVDFTHGICPTCREKFFPTSAQIKSDPAF